MINEKFFAGIFDILPVLSLVLAGCKHGGDNIFERPLADEDKTHVYIGGILYAIFA
jgi:hypothetical protein